MGYKRPRVIYKIPNEPRDNSILRYIHNRVTANNQNFLCAVTGGTGTGKSWASCSMAEMYGIRYGIEFDCDVHEISSLKELLLMINNKKKYKIRFGSVIVFDEPQVEANARDWQSDINRALGRLVSTFRNQRLVIFFATPRLDFIDKQSRILFHAEFECEGFDKSTGITKIKPRFLYPKLGKGEFYKKRLSVEYAVEGKKMHKKYLLHYWYIPKPSQEVIDIYEGKKDKFSNVLNHKLLNDIQMQEKIEEGRNKSDEFFKIKELYEKYKDNYEEILKAMPHLNAFTLDKYLIFIRKSIKARKIEV